MKDRVFGFVWLKCNVRFRDISAIKWLDGIAVHAVSKVRPVWHPRHGQLGFFYVPSLPRHGHGDIWRHLWGLDREVHFFPRPYLLPLFLKRRARKIFLVSPPLPFPLNYSPLFLLPAPHLPLPSYSVRPLIFNLIAIPELQAIRICQTSITTISLSHNPKRYLYKTAVGMQDREATFRILEKALRALRNSHLDPLSPYFNNIMNNNKRPESLITCMWISSTTIVGVSVRKKKHGRGQYVYLLQPKFVKYCQELHQGKVEKG